MIPKSLQAELPYSSKPKNLTKLKAPTVMQKRAVVMDEHEKKIYSLMQAINTIKHDKDSKRKEKETKQRAVYSQKKQDMEVEKAERKKRNSKVYFEKMGKREGSDNAATGGISKKRKKM